MKLKTGALDVRDFRSNGASGKSATAIGTFIFQLSNGAVFTKGALVAAKCKYRLHRAVNLDRKAHSLGAIAAFGLMSSYFGLIPTFFLRCWLLGLTDGNRQKENQTVG